MLSKQVTTTTTGQAVHTLAAWHEFESPRKVRAPEGGQLVLLMVMINVSNKTHHYPDNCHRLLFLHYGHRHHHHHPPHRHHHPPHHHHHHRHHYCSHCVIMRLACDTSSVHHCSQSTIHHWFACSAFLIRQSIILQQIWQDLSTYKQLTYQTNKTSWQSVLWWSKFVKAWQVLGKVNNANIKTVPLTWKKYSKHLKTSQNWTAITNVCHLESWTRNKYLQDGHSGLVVLLVASELQAGFPHISTTCRTSLVPVWLQPLQVALRSPRKDSWRHEPRLG